MINFSDIIKGKFIEEFSTISMNEVMMAIAVSFILSLFIVFIYKITYAGVNYSQNFAGCLIMLCMVTTVVLLVISSNVVLSLGMVGALSIVRFRTAVKEPADTAFLFWSIATGITCGAGFVSIAFVATFLLGLLFVGIYAFSKGQKTGSYLIVMRYDNGATAEEQLMKLPGFRLKNKTMNPEFTETVGEVRLKDMAPVNALQSLPGVREISIMASVSGSAL